MPDGVRNGIADKSSDTNFLSDDEEEEERDERNIGGVSVGQAMSITSSLPPSSGVPSENDKLTPGGRNSRNKNKAALLPLSPLSLPQPHPQQSSLNFFDLLKTGAMVGEKNGNSGQTPAPTPVPPAPNANSNSSRLRLASGPRDSDYVILVLNQKQREDDEVSMLIDRLRENGVSCLFMKNGTNNTNSTTLPSAKSPTPLVTPAPLVPQSEENLQVSRSSRPRSRSPFRPLVKPSIFLLSPEKVQNPPNPHLPNGKNSCDCPHLCNGVCGGTLRQFSTSCSSDSSAPRPSIDTESVFNKIKLLASEPPAMLNKKVTAPPLILRLPIPSLKIGVQPPIPLPLSPDKKESLPLPPAPTSGLLDLDMTADEDSQSSEISPIIKHSSSGDDSGNKKKRKRRRKYPYMVRKPVKKRKLSSQKTQIAELLPTSDVRGGSSGTPTEVPGKDDELSSRITNPAPSPLIIPSPLLQQTKELQSPKKPVRVQKAKPKPKPTIKVKLQPGRGRPKKSLKSQIAVNLSPKHKSKSGKFNGFSLPQSSSSSPLLHSPNSGSDDPYVFIPDDGDDFETPPPIKLFSPKSVRKNGLCSPSNGIVVGVPTFSPTSTTNLLTVPTWPPAIRKLSPSTVTTETANTQLSPSMPSTKLDKLSSLKPTSTREEPLSSTTTSAPQELPVPEVLEVTLPVPEVPPPEEAEASLPVKKKAKRKKRTNEVSQLLTWAISPRPSTPRSTLSMAFLSKDNVNKNKDKDIELQTPSAVIETPTEILPPETETIANDTVKSEETLPVENESANILKVVPPASQPRKIMADEASTRPEITPTQKEDKPFPVQKLPELVSPPMSSSTPILTELPKDPPLKDVEVEVTPPTEPSTSPPLIEASVGKKKRNVVREGKVSKRKRKARSALYYKGKKPRVQNKKSFQVQEISEFVGIEAITCGESSGCANKMEEAIQVLKETDTESKLGPRENSDLGGDTKLTLPETTKSLRTEKAANLEKVLKKVEIAARESKQAESKETTVQSEDNAASSSTASPLNTDPSLEILPSKTLPSSTSPPKPSKNDDLFKIPAIPEQPSTSSTTPSSSLGATPPSIPNSFLDAMQLRRRPSFYALIAGNVRNNMENFLDGRPPSPSSESGCAGPSTKFKRRKKPRPRPRNGFLLHHGDNFPEDPEAPYKLHLATQIILKLNKRRSKFKPKEDKGKSLLSYLKLVPKRVSRTSKQNPAPTPSEDATNSAQEQSKAEDQVSSVFTGEWVQPRNFVCNICGQVETDFWDMVHHKGEIHPGIVVTHVELPELPPVGFRGPPAIIPAASSGTSSSGVPPCSKCGANFSSYPDLHLHIFECAGNTTWLNALKEEEAQPARKKKSKRKRGFNRFKRRLSNTPKKSLKLKTESSPQKRRTIEVFKCEFCTREFKTEGWLKNHLTTHSLPISIPLEKLKLKQSLPARASSLNMGRRSVVQNLLANGSFKTVT